MKSLQMKEIVGWPQRGTLILDYSNAGQTHARQQNGDRA
jgi:hypothetical protein